MTNPAGESNGEALKLDFDLRLMLQFPGTVTAEAGCAAPRREPRPTRRRRRSAAHRPATRRRLIPTLRATKM